MDFYVGPYIEVATTLVKRTISSCRDPANCPNPSSPYRSLCGERTPLRQRVEATENPAPDFYDMFGDALLAGLATEGVAAKTHRLIPNDRMSQTRVMLLMDNGDIEEVAPGEIDAGIAWLTEEYEEEIESLRAAGFKPLVKWGAMAWVEE